MIKRILSIILVFCMILSPVINVGALENSNTNTEETKDAQKTDINDELKQDTKSISRESSQSVDVVEPVVLADEIPTSGTCGPNATWRFENDTLIISGTGGMNDFHRSFNQSYTTPWDHFREKIQYITIKNGITGIGEFAFVYCNSLTSISIPNSVTDIGSGAFFGCSSLTSISIPNSVTYIGASVFPGCSSLTSINIPNSISSLGAWVFSDCSSLTSISIPNSITYIDEAAFFGCSSLTSISIPNSVTGIGNDAFSGCSSLTSISIPNSISSLEAWVFDGCSSLTSISIPNSITYIGNGAFSDCSSLISISIPNSVTGIGNDAFSGCSSLTSISIPDSVTGIGNEAFYDCSNLTSISIPNSVTSIGDYAFGGCDSLMDIYYMGDETSWQNIKNVDNAAFTTATIHYNAINPPITSGTDMGISEHEVSFYPGLPDSDDGFDMVSLGIDWGWKLFNQSPATYDNRLTMAGLSLSSAAEKSQETTEHMLKALGFDTKEPHSENYDQPWYQIAQPGVTFGYKCVINDNGKKQHIFAVVLRGTTNAADIITDISSIIGGFTISAEFTKTLLESYILDCGLRPKDIKNDVKFFVTGHSLGGAVANITAQKLNKEYGADKVFAYTFATPPCISQNSYLLDSGIKNIFNFLNQEDKVPLLYTSMTKRYGIDFWISRFNMPAIYENFKSLTNGKDLKAVMESWWPLTDKIWYAHSVSTYMACLMGSREEGFAKIYITMASFLCPVDVEIYVSDGASQNQLVGRIKDNVVDISDGICAYVDGDKKYIYFPYEGDYTLKMIGADIGTMEYAVREINPSTYEVASEKVYKNVTLFNGKHMSSEVSVWNKDETTGTDGDKINEQEIPLYVLDKEGNIVKKVLEDGKGTEVNVGNWAEGEDLDKNKTPTPGKTEDIKVEKIAISGLSHQIATGKKITLEATVSPSNATNKSITWKSSNTKYATVNSKGIVTIKKAGKGKTVTITATANDGSGKKASYKIKCMKGVVKKVAISGQKTQSLKVGKSVNLKTKVTASKGANKTLQWTSSNKKYATVSNKGKVTTRKAGKGKTVKITAMATDGSNKKASVKVKIK